MSSRINTYFLVILLALCSCANFPAKTINPNRKPSVSIKVLRYFIIVPVFMVMGSYEKLK